MGIQVQGNTCIQGYFDMANSSVNSNSNVVPYHMEIKPSMHLSEKFTILSSNGSLHYDKEMLKRTMLVHEATFRKQVYELHRLYKIQKDLMAQFQSEFNSCPRYADAFQPSSVPQAPLGGIKGVWQTETPISGHDLKQSSIEVMNESSSQYSVSGAPLNNQNDKSRKKLLDLQLPADVYTAAAADDDDVEILYDKPSRSLPGANGSLLGGNFKLNLENSMGFSHVGKSWITDVQAHHARILNKPVEESCNMKTADFLGVGISSQNQHNVSKGVNLNLISLEGNLKQKFAGKVSGSGFFGANEEVRHNSTFRQRKDDSNASMAWSKYKRNCTDSAMGHYSFSASTSNHFILPPPGLNHTLNSPWQSNNINYFTKGPYGAVETSIANHVISNSILLDSTPKIPYHHSLTIHGEPQYRKLPPLRDNLKDINLNDAPVDTTATWKQGNDKSVVDISGLSKKLVSPMKSQVPLSCANAHSKNFISPRSYSESRTPTRAPTFPITVAAEKDSRCSPTLQYDLNFGPSVKLEADMEMQPQSKEADTNIRNFIDLNQALPIMDDPVTDIHESEGDIVSDEPDDPSRDSLATTAAEILVAMCNVVVEPGSRLDALHWFADLATLGNSVLDKDTDDEFEALTLKLQETKSDKYHSPPRTHDDSPNGGHCSAASLLVSKPQRGKGRGRRQRKDFQKDILPGLASLPRHEVSEDLRAFGRPKPVTPTKRGVQNGQQPRGRRRTRSVAVAVEEDEVSPPPVPPSHAPADLDADVLGITRWGRTTRRCRRPRCPPASNASLHVA